MSTPEDNEALWLLMAGIEAPVRVYGGPIDGAEGTLVLWKLGWWLVLVGKTTWWAPDVRLVDPRPPGFRLLQAA